MSEKVLFVGHFSELDAVENIANSPAGNIVQKEIIDSCKEVLGYQNVEFIAQRPMPVWPRGPFFVNSINTQSGKFTAFVNLPFIKSICFAISLLIELVNSKEYTKIVQYNSYFWNNLIVIMSGLTSIIIIQDVRFGDAFGIFNRVVDFFSIKLLKRYDIVVPVNEFMGKSLGIKPERVVVFPGGITSFDNKIRIENVKLDYFATFAGALEPYNGIDILLKKWKDLDLDIELHIFGSGSLESDVIEATQLCHLITYHGNVSQETVAAYQSKAMYNFCLRLPIGIKEEYFYPSKFFNIVICPGLAIYNDFYGLPNGYRSLSGVTDSSLSNLDCILKKRHEIISTEARYRINFTRNNYTWKYLIQNVMVRK